LLIVTSNLNYFDGPSEKNQAFIDGGLFAMSLLYALHFKEIGAIPLNWSYVKSQDQELHKLNEVKPNEKVIMFIGVGYPPSKFRVAASKRRKSKEISFLL